MFISPFINCYNFLLSFSIIFVHVHFFPAPSFLIFLSNLFSEVQNRNNCALDETSMKLGIVVDHNPDVENPMRTHLKTVPVPRSDDVIIGQDRKFFHKKI